MTEKEWYRPDEIEAALRISRRTVYRMIEKKLIQAIRVRGQWRIPESEYRKLTNHLKS